MRGFLSFLSATLLALQIPQSCALPEESVPTAKIVIPNPPARPGLCDAFPQYDYIQSILMDRLNHNNDMAKARILAKTGYPETSRELLHYLEGSGKDLEVDVGRVLKNKNFGAAAKWLVVRAAQVKLEEMKTMKKGQRAFRTYWKWHDYTQERDLFRDYGKPYVSITGVVTKSSNKRTEVDYVVHLYRHYRWYAGYGLAGEPKPGQLRGGTVRFGTVAFDPFRLGGYHEMGLAKRYWMKGRSKVLTIKDVHRVKIPEDWAARILSKPTEKPDSYCYSW
jgi:hypothetical protein